MPTMLVYTLTVLVFIWLSKIIWHPECCIVICFRCLDRRLNHLYAQNCGCSGGRYSSFITNIIPHWVFANLQREHVLSHNVLAALAIDIFTDQGDGTTILSNNLGNTHMVNCCTSSSGSTLPPSLNQTSLILESRQQVEDNGKRLK